MDGEGESGEEGLRAAAAAAAAAGGAWTTATYQTGELSNVVHIIVPDLTCIPQSKYVCVYLLSCMYFFTQSFYLTTGLSLFLVPTISLTYIFFTNFSIFFLSI